MQNIKSELKPCLNPDCKSTVECKCGECLLCLLCINRIDICPNCKVRIVEVDDFGVMLCAPCFENDERAKQAISVGNEREAFKFGY